MTRYIAFLRAVNVGGRTVKMEALRGYLAMPGFKNIATYIQSGNVAFDHKSEDRELLIKKIESKLLKELNFEVRTLIRTVTEIAAIIQANPFGDIPDGMALHVSFLSAVPSPELVAVLDSLQTEFEQFKVVDTEAYILVKKGAYGEVKFSNTFLEKKLKVAATTRNWPTINRMMEL
jgi:uncharacterized protein (DUF1697 family)